MTAVTYTSTEKKRIRKSFAKRQAVLNVPFLLATQLESYTAFLQAAVPPHQRKTEGLQAAFNSIFPISSHSGNAKGRRAGAASCSACWPTCSGST